MAKSKQCPYCSEIILATARKCKHCGEILDAELKQSRDKVQRIEATGKVWKAIMLVGGLLIVASVPFVVMRSWAEQVGIGWVGAISVFAVGTTAYAVGRAGAWWYHG
jgi:hypothetical protein